MVMSQQILGLDLKPTWDGSGLESLLSADLDNVVFRSNLPPSIDKLHNQVLSGTFLLQVNSSSDISQSRHSLQQQEKDRQEKQQEGQIEMNGTRTPQNAHRRMLKLQLTDGVQTLYGVEYRSIQALIGNPGEKLLLENVLVRRGLLLLTEENTTSLGGSKVNSSVEVGGEAQQSQEQVIPRDQQQQTEPRRKELDEDDDISMEQLLALEAAEAKHLAITTAAPSSLSHPLLQPSSQSSTTHSHPLVLQPSSQSSTTQAALPNTSERDVQRDVQRDAQRDAQRVTQREEAFKFFRELEVGETGFVKGFVMGVSVGLRSKEGKFSLSVEIGDGLGGCVCEIDALMIERHIVGYTLAQTSRMKKNDKEQYKTIMQQAASKLQNMEGLFRVTKAGPETYHVSDIQVPGQEYIKHLLESS